MKIALARHDTILREIVQAHGGHVFKTMGDAFCAAFQIHLAALETALAAQRALLAEPWPTPTPIRVRMALHTGMAEERDGDYFGPPLNRRRAAAGSGARRSDPAVDGDHGTGARPPAAGYDAARPGPAPPQRPLSPGAHFSGRRAGFARRISAAAHARRCHNQPARPADALIGRERELAAVLDLLRRADTRLVTLTGPGGTGKTRLALQIAADLLDEFAHGVYFVDLSPVRDPDLALSSIADALGVKEDGDKSLIDTLADYLRDKQMLLVLDNFEQVIARRRCRAT